MRKLLALISVLIMGIASVSIVASQEESSQCEDTIASECQECLMNLWCGDITDPIEKQRCIFYNSLDAFLICQQKWFHPYWMEIYSNEVKGCYARDLLCFNAPVELECPTSICEEICDSQECIDECCQRADCYLYGGELYTIEYPFERSQNGNKMVLTIPSCTDSRTFFQRPPPCGRVFEDVKVYDEEPTCCFDMRGCGSNPSTTCATQCTGYTMPANYRCDVNEYVIMEFEGCGEILINGVQLDIYPCNGGNGFVAANGGPHMIVWYNGEKPFESALGVIMIQGVPRTIAIEGEGYLVFSLEQKCCYDCKPKPSLPATILYPKVDIETLSIAGGPTIIKDGKILSSLTISPGVQQAMIQVENRGFFTQNDARVRFEGLPSGVTAIVSPDTQKITAHNIGTYSATFTVDPNVPSGTYKITLIAYSPNGVFDTLTIDFVVP